MGDDQSQPHINTSDLAGHWTCFPANFGSYETQKIQQLHARGQSFEWYHKELVMFLCCQNGMLTEKDKEVLQFGVGALVALA